jgi:hypothetical protein
MPRAIRKPAARLPLAGDSTNLAVGPAIPAVAGFRPRQDFFTRTGRAAVALHMI